MAPPAAAKRKRGRPQAAPDASTQHQRTEPLDETDNDDGGNQRPRKRGRPSIGSNTKKKQKATATATAEEEAPPANKKKRGRPSLQDLSASQANSVASKSAEAPASEGKTLRQSTRGGAASSSTRGGGRRGGRASVDVRRQSGKTRSRATAQGRDEHRQGEEVVEEGDEEKVEEEEQDHESDGDRDSRWSSSRPDQSSVAEDESIVVTDLPAKPYLHVAPRVRGVKQSIINAKWTPLGAPSIAAASTTLSLAYRPVMQSLAGTTQRRAHTSSALALVYKRVTRKLDRGLPFPPASMPPLTTTTARAGGDAGREAELDFESVLDGARALERQLDPALHAVELLRKEKERVERELEHDYKTLQNLEAGARGQAREQREQLKKAHVLVPKGLVPRGEELDMVFDGKPTSLPPGAAFKDLEDGELKTLALQLGDHMDSIKTNLQQTDGLQSQLAASRASLRLVLSRHLDAEQYQRAVLG